MSALLSGQGLGPDDCVPRLVVEPDKLSIGENGNGAFTIALEFQPAVVVTVKVTSLDPTAATVIPAKLTFTTADWDVAQTVTVTGIDDGDTDDETVKIRAQAFTTIDGKETPDPGGPDSVVVSVGDDDPVLSGDVVAAGNWFTCGVSSDFTMVCWGRSGPRRPDRSVWGRF